MFTEDELLEAVDILVEDYGLDEDEAIDLISEDLTVGSVYRGMNNMYRDTGKNYRNYKALKDNPNATDNDIKNARKKYYGSAGKSAAATALVATAVGMAAKDAYEKYPKYKKKMDRKKRRQQNVKRLKRKIQRNLRY